MIKFLDILKEGVRFDDNGEILISTNNVPDDLLIIKNGFVTKFDTTICYSLEYNNESKDIKGLNIKTISNELKKLNIKSKESLNKIITDGVNYTKGRVFNNRTLNKVYYLGSGASLSKYIADVIGQEFEVEVLPLNKIIFPTWQDMLVDDYKEKIVDVGKIKKVEDLAQRIWNENKGKLKSSGYFKGPLNQWRRDYFKPKYEEIIEELSTVLFVDDNFQNGLDFKHISKNFRTQPMFYALIKLNENSTQTKQEK